MLLNSALASVIMESCIGTILIIFLIVGLVSLQDPCFSPVMENTTTRKTDVSYRVGYVGRKSRGWLWIHKELFMHLTRRPRKNSDHNSLFFQRLVWIKIHILSASDGEKSPFPQAVYTSRVSPHGCWLFQSCFIVMSQEQGVGILVGVLAKSLKIRTID